MKVGDLVKLKWQGNGHPNVGLIIETVDGEHMVLWDLPRWNPSQWLPNELEALESCSR